MKIFTDKIILLRNMKKCATRSRFTPCTARASLLEEKCEAGSRFIMNLPVDFVRKNSGQNNQQPNQIELLKERTRQRQPK